MADDADGIAADPRIGDVLAEVRASCARVAAGADHVAIDDDAIASLAGRLDGSVADGDPGHRRLGDDEATAAFVITLDALNFGSGWFPWLRKRPGLSGYRTIATALRSYVEATGALTVERLARFTVEDLSQVLGQPLDGGRISELLERFVVALGDLAVFVDRAGGGRFLGVVEAAEGSAGRLAASLTAMPYYRDVHHHRTGPVTLLKRAQITAHDLAVAFDHAGPGAFADLDRLTMFADNLVPHVLRLEGVLVVDPEVVAAIDAGQALPSGSAPEVELRATGVEAVERLVTARRAMGSPLTAATIDGILWNTGARPEYKAHPRHRTRCVFY